MTIHRRFLAGLVCAWLICATANAQQNPFAPPYPAPTPVSAQPIPSTPLFPAPSPIPANGGAGTAQAPPTYASGGGLSDWIQYNSNATAVSRDCCMGEGGKVTPLFTELYLRVGPTMPVGEDTLTHQLKTGWSIVGGGRALFFDEPMTKAWAIDLSIINTYQSGGRNDDVFPLVASSQGTVVKFGTGGVPGVLVSAANRTMGGLGIGREWYLHDSANSDGCKWRFGLDVGGRWGTIRLDLSASQAPGHVTDVIAGMYAAIHTDLEYVTRYGIFFAGVRAEWSYTWSDVLQLPSNVESLTIFLEGGLRF